MTTYLIADSSSDYKAVHDLVKSEGMQDDPLTFPTIMAIKEGELVGALGTNTSQNMVVAGPLVLKGGQNRSFTAMRLVERYDEVMKQCGIKSYIFSVDLNLSEWIDIIQRAINIEPWKTESGIAWFRRELDIGRI